MIAESTRAARSWARRWCLPAIVAFFPSFAVAQNFVVACGTWDATTSTFTPYDVGGGSAVGACPSGNQIFVDVDALGVDLFGGLTAEQGAELGGAVILLWSVAWIFRPLRKVISDR